eukprot:CAMPEP_0175915810 /NCGR_PEP_ID=MMETSP0108-20121206/10512_1 /TAXON_ID=195067 ORGANISM="Goniomonas pacifica, Strain CCMP1869" /NCGR_SAMPLE_ID=MMETSP0108 /ASSEMBLY_ACC=CAM_ASM_000204 /LENGTH=218 /DNA_ID=CAMNT_0017238321 /DNA_START=77 /DNA_END=733 /DNA_ORIENTATION=+
MTLYGFIYYSDTGYQWLRSSQVGQIIEATCVFLPYVLFRPLFPVTHLGDAVKSDKNKTSSNALFYVVGGLIIKFFYITAKWYMGFFTTYARFLNLYTENEHRRLAEMVLANAGTVSIAIFLHTLRFKRILPPRVTFSVYVVMAYAPFMAVAGMAPFLLTHWRLLCLCTVGLVVNLAPRPCSKVFQVAALFLFLAIRHDNAPGHSLAVSLTGLHAMPLA